MTDARWCILEGDALARLVEMPDESVQCIVTSPPYYGLRDYGVDGQIGLEATPEAFVERLVAVFREARRVLRKDGTCWVNLGDSYANDGKCGGASSGKHVKALHGDTSIGRRKQATGLKPKDLIGVPWMFAFAARADGWFLRSEIIWSKPAPMPESVTDRPTKAHEQVFLLTKSERYFYDAKAVAEPVTSAASASRGFARAADAVARSGRGGQGSAKPWELQPTRNRRSVWTVASEPFADAHFAVMPTELARPCVLAGSAVGDLVLDPFAGAATTGVVALGQGRRFVGIELNPRFAAMARGRLASDSPLFDAAAR